jgi:hypothetical protein
MNINIIIISSNRAMDTKIIITLGTSSPARTVVSDTGEEILDLTLHSPRGPGLAFSYSGTGCGMKSIEAGNLAVIPKDIDPARRRQYPCLCVRTPTRKILRFIFLLNILCLILCPTQRFQQ